MDALNGHAGAQEQLLFQLQPRQAIVELLFADGLEHVGLVVFKRVQICQLLVTDGRNIVKEVVDGDLFFFIFHARKRLHQPPRRIRHDCCVHRVHICSGAAAAQLKAGHALHAQRYLKRSVVDVLAAAFPDDRVGLHHFHMLADKLSQMDASDLFFALGHEFDIDRKRSVDLLISIDGAISGKKAAFVVGHTARDDTVIDHSRHKRRRLPLLIGLGRHDVVVVIEHQGALFSVIQLAEHDWVAACFKKLCVCTKLSDRLADDLRHLAHAPVLG